MGAVDRSRMPAAPYPAENDVRASRSRLRVARVKNWLRRHADDDSNVTGVHRLSMAAMP